ncbi:MAG: phospholipid carrier-dependent glycosyltransferase [Actinomycetota bacterium]
MATFRALNRPVIAIALVTAMAGAVRFAGLDRPDERVFDELYYSKDGCLYAGYSREECDIDSEDEKYWVRERGEVGSWVHPPLGKWLIAAGEKAFGPDPLGSRVASAAAGTAIVAITATIAFLLFGSTVWSFVAGLLLATEPLSFVQSRVAMLDVFVAFWIALGFLFLVLDRRWIEGRPPRTEDLPDEEPAPRAPSPIWRPWRFAAGAALGAAVATKWSGASAILGAVILSMAWERSRRKELGESHPGWRAVTRESFGLALAFALVPVAIYLLSFARYFSQFGLSPTDFLRLQGAMADFHSNLAKLKEGTKELTHPYESNPWSWPLMSRPVLYYFKSPGSAVLAIGNPLIVWGSLLTVPYAAFSWFRKRDWRAGFLVVAILAQYLPWFLFPSRVQFFFYLTPIMPFLVLATVYALKALAEVRVGGSESHPFLPLATGFVIAAVALFVFFWPILTAYPLSGNSWQARMWFPNWV